MSAAASYMWASPTIRRPREPRNSFAKGFFGTRRHGTSSEIVIPRSTRWATTATAMNIFQVLTAPRSPWQNADAERFIGSIPRECLDHVIVANERGLREILRAYVEYYLKSRAHLSLAKDSPISRPVAPPGDGTIVAIPHVGGLHHRYERCAA
jgi:hypothetical protein